MVQAASYDVFDDCQQKAELFISAPNAARLLAVSVSCTTKGWERRYLSSQFPSSNVAGFDPSQRPMKFALNDGPSQTAAFGGRLGSLQFKPSWPRENEIRKELIVRN